MLLANNQSHTALMVAAERGVMTALELLLQHMPQRQLACRDASGRSALDIVVAAGQPSALAALLPHVADPAAISRDMALLSPHESNGHGHCYDLLHFTRGASGLPLLAPAERQRVYTGLRQTLLEMRHHLRLLLSIDLSSSGLLMTYECSDAHVLLRRNRRRLRWIVTCTNPGAMEQGDNCFLEAALRLLLMPGALAQVTNRAIVQLVLAGRS